MPVVGPAATGRAADADVLRLLQQGKKIEEMKLVRERTGLRLREAKDLVEGWWSQATTR